MTGSLWRFGLRWALALVVGVAGCHAAGSSAVVRASLDEESGWVAVRTVPALRQAGDEACGDTALAMVLQYWGRPGDPAAIRAASGQPAHLGLRAAFLRDHLRAQGLHAFLLEGTTGDLERELAAGRPVIVGIARPARRDATAHYQIAVGFNRVRQELWVIDPDTGWHRYGLEAFEAVWRPTHSLMIVASPVPPGGRSHSTGGVARRP